VESFAVSKLFAEYLIPSSNFQRLIKAKEFEACKNDTLEAL
jgi:hypothetical protein